MCRGSVETESRDGRAEAQAKHAGSAKVSSFAVSEKQREKVCRRMNPY